MIVGEPASMLLASPVPAKQPVARLVSIDLLRGLVMVLMVLDHVRDFFSNAPFDPTDLRQTTAAYFLTRWVTHFCAPVFLLLAGTGAYLQTARGRTRPELSRFLLTRGLWLVVLELTFVHFGWTFQVLHTQFIGAVIWVIGWCMVVLAGLIYLPVGTVTLIGVSMILLHNLTDGIPAAKFGPLKILWAVLHTGEPVHLFGDVELRASYPLIPWAGVMAVGYGLGQLYQFDAARRGKWLLALGTALTAGFVLVRATNFYGDASHWSTQRSFLFTLFSFLNCTKYPPSLCYLLMTLGPAMLLLKWFERGAGVIARPLLAFGRAPLFFYLVHLPLIHGLAAFLAWMRPDPAHLHWLLHNSPFADRPVGYGFDLWVVYLIWLAVIITLYPVCRRFADWKHRSRMAWLSYL
jgi:uncharacterized membrane protein